MSGTILTSIKLIRAGKRPLDQIIKRAFPADMFSYIVRISANGKCILSPISCSMGNKSLAVVGADVGGAATAEVTCSLVSQHAWMWNVWMHCYFPGGVADIDNIF
ncbi:hypothetical protein JTB14_024882 [Gonioctena quinquepunctata]|nr:hypothetical protein JTB14_024882 [Gonioctena quinquepunctata]